MSYQYHYGIPGYAVWISHIILGLYLVYIGYHIVTQVSVNKINGLILITLGTLAFFYHLHLLLLNK